MAVETSLTNQMVIDMIKSNSIDGTCKHMLENTSNHVAYDVLYKDLSRLLQKFQYLNKSKSRVKGKENLDRFLMASYKYPDTENKQSNNEKCTKQSRPTFLASDDTGLQVKVYKDVCFKLASEVSTLQDKNTELEEELDLIVNEKDDLNESIEGLDKKLNTNRKQLKRTMQRENYWREKSMKLDDNGNDEILPAIKDENTELKLNIREKDNEINQLKQQILELKDNVNHLTAVENAEFFDDTSKTYIPELHACVYSLLDHQVSCENVPNVINSVCKLLNKTPNKLPTSRTINNWSIERSVIARKQISETSDKEFTTLHTDEASKYGQKWGAFATRDSEGNYMLLGLRDMATKSSQDTLDTFKEILTDIDSVSKNEKSSAASILVNIKNTMSDRASTETKFNQLLKEYREEILPEVFENYENLNIESQQAINRMNNFFCGLHTLVHMADVSQKAINDIEHNIFDEVPIHNPMFQKSGQSGTVRLILTACKTFARRGDQKSGCYQSFRVFISDFLKQNKLLSLPLQPLRGNRFNILFSNAGHVYFLKDQMKLFLSKTSNTNGLLQSVLHDLNVPVFLSGCKALGLISKYITTPLWRIIENKDINISEMNQKYQELLNYITSAIENLEDFITGRLILFEDVPIKDDKILECLLAQSEFDENTVVLLSVILPAMAKLIKHQYCDHLPGGVHENINVTETASVDKHNKFPERVFSLVDHLLAAKPNISTLALEAQISFSLNRTSEWLNEQENINEIILQSRKEAHKERLRFKERAKSILAKRIEKQEDDFRKREIQEQNRVNKLEKTTNEMLFYGLWQSAEQVEKELSEIKSEKEKENALKCQLRFRKDVFKQTSTRKDVYAFSRLIDGKRRSLSVEELKDNVVFLIGNVNEVPSNEREHFLVNKKIKHKWIEAGEEKWYNGRVISQVPGFPTWFNVVYDDDPAVYTSQLGEEYKEGDVVVKA